MTTERPTGPAREEPVDGPGGNAVRLQAELVESERRLSAAFAELVEANAGLRSGNAEQQALNEELSASNEEFAASEREMQVLNTILGTRMEELAQANSDLRSVIESTRIAIVFLDEQLRIRSFTPAVQAVLHVRDADRGRPVTDLALQIAYPTLAQDAHQVLRTNEALERRAGHGFSGAEYLIRLLLDRHADGSVAGVVVTFLDITATVQAERALRASDERFRRMAAAVPAILFIAEAATAWVYVNPPFYTLTGQPAGSALGSGWWSAVHPDDADAMRAAWREAEATASTLEHEMRFCRPGGSWCWFLVRAVPQIDKAGRLQHWYGSCTDIDDRRRAERRQSLLLGELQHRIKNILAVVRSVLTRTMESSTDLDHFAEHLAGRIGALARTQGVSARTVEGLVMLEDIVFQELEAHGGTDERQVDVEGPPVPLPAKTADAIGLAVHELATNSIKYGALATASGRVVVRWRILAPGSGIGPHRLGFEWRESGVPLTNLSPKRRGFGRELIEHGLPYELGALTAMEFRPGGLRCSIEIELEEIDGGPALEQASAS